MQIIFNSPYYLKKRDIKRIIPILNKELNLRLDSITIHFISDEAVLEINRQYLGHDFYTDIITFDLRDEFSQEAEIYISAERIEENSRLHYATNEEELARVCIHGLLHLSGVKDKTEKEKKHMTELEEIYLKKLFHVKP